MIGEPQFEQNSRWTPSGVLNVLSESFPLSTTKSLAATMTFDANAEPLALRHREQWQ
jgi:hypothetical protein